MAQGWTVMDSYYQSFLIIGLFLYHISAIFIDKTVSIIISRVYQESNGPSDAYAAISNADRLQAEPESLRKWREEQRERLELLGKHRAEPFFKR